MKILVVHNHYIEAGGEDRAVDAEIKMLRDEGHEVVFCEGSNSNFRDLSVLKKIKFLLKDIIWSQDNYNKLRDLVRREKPDIAHVHNIFVMLSPSIYYALYEEGIPVVQTLHNYRFICPGGLFYRNHNICQECRGGNFLPALKHRCWKGSFLLTFAIKRVLDFHFKKGTFINKINFYIALSEFSKSRFIEAGFPSDKILVKPNFIGIRPEARVGMGDYALFIGRLAEYKGIVTLISAYRELNNYKLKVLGDGPLLKTLKRNNAGFANIEFLGRVASDQIADYIKGARFVIFPSECYENMPLVIIESFACGVPVLASNIGAAKEMVDDRINGLLFEAGNKTDLRDKIRYLFNNKQLLVNMGRNARLKCEDKYSLEENYPLLLEIYNRCKFKEDAR